jgi:hypothetical protein
VGVFSPVPPPGGDASVDRLPLVILAGGVLNASDLVEVMDDMVVLSLSQQ